MYRKCLKMTGILLLAALFTTVAWSSVQAEEPQITIDFWVGGGNRHIPGYDTPNHGDWERLLAREFEKLHPNVKINVEIISFSDIEQKVNVAVAGQNPPDILYDNIPNRVMRHARNGELEPLDAVVSADRNDWKEDFLAMGTHNGVLYGLPLSSTPTMMFVNKTILERKGVAHLLPEDRHWTWEEWEEVMAAVSDGRIYGTAFHALNEQADQLMVCHLVGAGSAWLSDDLTEFVINSPEGVEALEFMVSLIEKGYVAPGPASMAPGDALELFQQGRVAALQYVPAVYERVAAAIEAGAADPTIQLYGMLPPTKEDVAPRLTVTGEEGYALFKQDDPYKKEICLEFIEFLASPEHVRLLNQATVKIPARYSATYEIEDPEISTMMGKLAEYPVLDIGKSLEKYADTRQLFYPEMQAAFLGLKTPQEALDSFVSKANELIQK